MKPKLKSIQIIQLVYLFPLFCLSQVNEINFYDQNIDFSSAPRTNISPNSIKLWDNYNNGGPTAYGTVMEIYGKGNHQTGQLYFGGWDNSKIRYRESFYAQNIWSEWITMLDSKNDVKSNGNLLITGNSNSYILNGNLGIGTTNPMQKFVVSKGGAEGLEVYLDQPSGVVGLQSYNRALSSYSKMQFSASQFSFTNGNVGIGTINPDAKLTVNGTIHATEVKVTQTVPADYVFQKYYTGKSELKPDYHLPTLSDVEKFTQVNHHLPNVPSAAEIKENGLLLGEISNILLQKIEELTLYAIEQQKKNNLQSKEIELQSKEIETLKKENESFNALSERLYAIENKLKK